MGTVLKNLRVYLILSAVLILGGCASSGFKTDAGKVNSIKNIAVISFTVPGLVAEKNEGTLSGLSALVNVVSGLVSGKEKQGNGEQVASEAAEGFIDTFAESGRWHILPLSRVTTNKTVNALVKDGSDNALVTSMKGTPAIVLDIDGDSSALAAQAARALNVDGVIAVSANDIHYFLYTGTVGTGQAKAKGSAIFTLYDRQGRAVWVSSSVIWSKASAAMIAGAIDPTATARLHRSIGEGIARDLLQQYKKQSGS